jgi:polyvinyl alcohol dehydrogenase (cytochrome)
MAYMIPSPARRTRRNSSGTQLWGPSGAGVWSAPTLDRKRRLIYVTTGDHYSDPEEGFGDSVVAIEMATGKMAWGRKLLEGDRWNLSCFAGDKSGCPKNAGPDFDFGSSAILHTLSSGKQLLLAGQKSGVLYILDPDKRGEVVRQVRVGNRSVLGGIEWGSGADSEKVYVAISDLDRNNPEAGGGVMAIQIATGEKVWHTPAPKPTCLGQPGCSAAQPWEDNRPRVPALLWITAARVPRGGRRSNRLRDDHPPGSHQTEAGAPHPPHLRVHQAGRFTPKMVV